MTFNRPASRRSHAGLGDAEVGFKYRFFNRPDDGWSAAVYPTLDLPTGDAGRGLGNGRAQLLLPLWFQRSSGDWSWDAGIARLVNRPPDARNSWLAGLLARRSFGQMLSLGAEMYGRTSTAAGEPSVTGFNVGAIISVSPHQNVLVSAGRADTSRPTSSRCSWLINWSSKWRIQPVDATH